MKMVNDILSGKSLNEYLKNASREQILDLRVSASVGINAEKSIKNPDGTVKNQKYINFLSAVIQECDKTISLAKRAKARLNGDFLAVVSEYELFRKITKDVVSESVYSEIMKALEVQLLRPAQNNLNE